MALDRHLTFCRIRTPSRPQAKTKTQTSGAFAFWRGRFAEIREHSRLRGCEPFRRIRTKDEDFAPAGATPFLCAEKWGKDALGNHSIKVPQTPPHGQRGSAPCGIPVGRRKTDGISEDRYRFTSSVNSTNTKPQTSESFAFLEDVLPESTSICACAYACMIPSVRPFRPATASLGCSAGYSPRRFAPPHSRARGPAAKRWARETISRGGHCFAASSASLLR